MRFRDFMKNRVFSTFSHIVFMLFLFLFVWGVTKHLYPAIFIVSLYALVIFAGEFYEYWKKRRFYGETMRMLSNLPMKTLIGQMLPEAEFCEAEILKEILNISLKGMNDEIAKYKRISNEYRQYIEMWIHEVKTPIASAKLLLDNHEELAQKGMLEDLDQIEAYVEQALYYARSTSLEKDYIVKKCRLDAIVRGCIKKNRRSFITQKVEVEMGEMETYVYTDEKWALFVLNQIVGNALKYTATADGKISFSAIKQDNRVELLIKDNGIGIQACDLPRVFEKGFTGSNGRNYEKATGMGLFLVKELCDKLGLDVRIESKEGVGTWVYISFPVDEVQALLRLTKM